MSDHLLVSQREDDQYIEKLKAERDALARRVAELEAALLAYCEHRSNCASIQPVPDAEANRILASREGYVVPACTCGLDAALASTDTGETP